MNRHYLRLMAVLSWVLVPGMSVVAIAQDGIVDVRGSWTIYSRSIDNGALARNMSRYTRAAPKFGAPSKARTSRDRFTAP